MNKEVADGARAGSLLSVGLLGVFDGHDLVCHATSNKKLLSRGSWPYY